jgi:subtilisin family serine protease
MAVSVPVTALDELRNDPDVAVVEPDGEFHISDTELDNTWGVKHIGAGNVHPTNFGSGIKVAVFDSGIDCTHPDLDGNCAGGIDFVNDDNDPMDDNGHGTHVAGTVAAEDNGTGVVGVAPGATLYAVKVMNESGSGSFSDIIAALEWAVDNGIQVTNHSYGTPSYPGSIVEAAFDNAYAAGVVHIAAAGNSGQCSGTTDTVEWPGRFDSVVAVAATYSNDTRPCFSSTGSDVEIAAPGIGINSTRLGGGYTVKSGTSMASPHVAGTAALVIASGVTSPPDVRQRLRDTAIDLGPPGPDTHFGYGLVDAEDASGPGAANQPPGVTLTAPPNGSFYSAGTAVFFSGTASDPEDGDLTSDLSWSSSIDGPIGTGGTFSAVLSVGTHLVSATVTDSGSLSASGTTTIQVRPVAPKGTRIKP